MLLAVAVGAALAPIAALTAPAQAQTPEPGSATTWFFAEGNTLPNWFEFITIINPDPNNDISVTIDYQLEEPAGVPAGSRSRTIAVPAGQRATAAVYDDLGRAVGAGLGQPGVYTGVSARLTSTANFVAERPMYFINNFDVGEVNGTHDALGVNTASRTWYFAEGSTLQSPAPDATGVVPGAAGQLRGFMPFWTMQNTSGNNANVTITYRTNNPDSVVEKRIVVPNNSRITTDIANAFSNPAYPGSLGPGFEGFGTSIASDQPIIVERPFYTNREFPGIGFVNAATDERGALTANTTTRLFAEGTVLDTFFPFITVFNPNTDDAQVELEYQIEGQTTPVTKTLAVPGLSRRTVQVYNEASPGGLGRALPQASAPLSAGFSVRLESTNGIGIVAERPMYFIHDFGNGPVNGSHDVLGAATGDTSWFFAEGTLRNGFFEFITIQNPNDEAARARLDYFVQGRGVVTNFRDLDPNSRTTVSAHDPTSEGSLAAAGISAPSDTDFGLRVTSIGADGRPANDREIVVERPMYVNAVIASTPPAINGGHNTLGFQFPAGDLPPLPGQLPDTTGPDVTIAKRSEPDQNANGGTQATFILRMSNIGTARAVGVVAEDTLPAGMTYDDAATDAANGTNNCHPGTVGDPNAAGAVTCFPNGAAALDPGQAVDVRIVVDVTCVEGGPTQQPRINQVQIFGQNDTNTNNNTATDNLTVNCPLPAGPVLTVDKESAPNPAQVGEEVTYTITVTNSGGGEATDVTLSDTLPAGANLVRAPGCTDDDAGTVTCTIGTVAANGGTAVRTVTVTFDDEDTFTNNVTVTSENATTDTDTEETTVTAPAPRLAVGKDSTPNPAQVGEEVTYTITVENDGQLQATGVVLTDTLDPQSTLVRAPDCTDNGAGTVTCTIGTLDPDEIAERTIVVVFTATGTHTNTVVATADGGITDGDTEDTTVTGPAPLLVLDKTDTGSDPSEIGEDVTYTLTLQNRGQAAATGVVLSDTLPADAQIVDPSSNNATPTVTDNVVEWEIGTLAPNETVVETIVVRFADDGSKEDTASAGCNGCLAVQDTEFTTITAPADLEVTKTAEAGTDTRVGDLVTYTILVANNGPGDAFDVTLSDTLPDANEATVISIDPSQGDCTDVFDPAGAEDQAFTCDLDTINDGDTATVTVVVRAEQAGQMSNFVVVDAANRDPNEENNDDFEVVFVRGGPPPPPPPPGAVADISIEKTGPLEVARDELVTYTVTVNNPSGQIAGDVVVIDELPNSNKLSFFSYQSTQGTCTFEAGPGKNQSLACALGNINPNTTVTILITMVPEDDTGPGGGDQGRGAWANCAEVTSTNDPNDANNGPECWRVFIRAVADLSIDKIITDTPFVAGGEVTFTLVVHNDGPSDVDAVITDLLPPDVTFVRSEGCDESPGAPGDDQTQTIGGRVMVTCTIGIDAGDPETATIVGSINFAGQLDDIPNCANVQPYKQRELVHDRDQTDNEDCETFDVVPGADIIVDKEPDPGDRTANPGEVVTYTILVTNRCCNDTTNVTVTDTHHGDQTVTGATWDSQACTVTGDQVVCNLGAMASGATRTITVTTTIDAGAQPDDVITDVAVARSNLPDPFPANNTDEGGVTVGAGEANLVVTKTNSEPVIAGEEMTWTITVRNNGPSTARSVSLTDTLTGDQTFIRGDEERGACTFPTPGTSSPPARTFSCQLGDIPVNDEVTVTIVVVPDEAGTITDTAIADSTTFDPSSPNQVTDTAVAGPSADLVVTKANSEPVVAGEEMTWTITVRNDGPSDAQSVSLTDTLSGDQTFIRGDEEQGACAFPAPGTSSPGPITFSCQLDTILENDEVTVTIVVEPDQAGTITDTAIADSTTFDTNEPNQVTDTAVAGPSADLVVTKANSEPVVAGEEMTWTVTVRNNGPSTASSVSLTDTLTGDQTLLRVIPERGTCAFTPGASSPPEVTFSCQLGDIPVNDEVTVTIVVRPDSEGTITDTAIADSTTSDPSEPNQVTDTAVADPASDLAVNKVGPATAPADAPITYTVTVTNLGPSVATGTIVTDTLEGTGTIVTATASNDGPCTVNAVMTQTVCVIGNLAPQQTVTITITATTPATADGDVITDTAEAQSRNRDNNQRNNRDNATTTIGPAVADIQVAKMSNPGVGALDAEVTVTITNTGPSSARAIDVTDTITVTLNTTTAGNGSDIDNLQFTHGTCVAFNDIVTPTNDEQVHQIRCTGIELEPGEVALITYLIDATSADATAGSFENVAEAESRETGDPESDNNRFPHAGALSPNT